MKKFMISLLMIAATLNAMAITYTGKVQVVLRATSNNAACAAVVATSDALNDGLNPSYYAELNDEGKEVLAYVEYNNVRYEHFGSSATTMRNMPLIIKANASGEYRMNFYEMEGAIEIYDKVAGANIDKTQPYIFTIQDEQKNTIIADRFVINYTYVIMNGDFADPDNAWAYTSNFAHNGATASLDLDLAADTWYHFQIEENGAIGANGSAFDIDHPSYNVPTTGWESQLTLHTSEAGSYNFTWTYASKLLTITFPAAPAPTYDAQVELNANGLATFSHHTLKLQAVEDGVKLYKGAVSGETLALTQVSVVEAHQGVIVYGAANTTYHFNETTASADFAGNQLIPSCEWENRGTGDIYVLSGDALYLYEGDQFPANKAFLEIANQGPAPRRIRLVFDQATAIDNISADNVKAEKVVENGQILIRRGNEVYNLQGQIVK